MTKKNDGKTNGLGIQYNSISSVNQSLAFPQYTLPTPMAGASACDFLFF